MTKTEREELVEWFNTTTYELRGADAARIRGPFFRLLRHYDDHQAPEQWGVPSGASATAWRTAALILGAALLGLLLTIAAAWPS